MDGFNQTTYADEGAFTQFHPDQITAYWNWAKRYAIADHFFASAVGPSFPNHMYSIAAHVGRRARQPVAAAAEPLRDAAAGLREVLGLRHRARRVRRGDRPRGLHGEGRAVLRLQDRGRPAERQAHPVGLLRGDRTASSATSGRRTPRSSATATTPNCGASTSGRSTTSSATSGRPAAARHVDHAAVPAVPAPRVQLLLGPELDHRGDQRADALRRVEGHARSS